MTEQETREEIALNLCRLGCLPVELIADACGLELDVAWWLLDGCMDGDEP